MSIGRSYSVERGVAGREGLYDDAPRTIRDLLTPSRVDLVNLTIAPYLRAARKVESNGILPPGYHWAFFPTSRSELDTLEDGYEKHFAPRHPFKRRLWTQGSLQFSGQGLAIGQEAVCEEKLHKVVESEYATDVWIERLISTSPEDSIREFRCLRYMKTIPQEDSAVKDEDAENNDHRGENASIVELLNHKFTPSRLLLTRFSYLTNNFHRIHVDSDYAQSVEKYPDVLMHGSLSIVIILASLSRHYQSKDQPLLIRQAKYAMYRPLYVNNPVNLTLSTRSSSNSSKPGIIRATLKDNHNRKAVECLIYQNQ